MQQEDTSQEDQLNKLLAEEKWQDALALLEKMPSTPENGFSKAELLIKLDRLDEAEKILKLLDGVYPQDKLSMKMGLLYNYLKKYPEAKYWLRIAMRYPSVEADAKAVLDEVLAHSPESYSDKDEKVIQLNPVQPKITFKDVIGMDDVKEYMYDNVINPIKHREEYLAVGKKIGTGVILTGPPGCGKTFIAEAVAGECGAFFINVQPSEVVGSFVGVTQKNISTIFLQARMHAPCIIFIDEIDNLGTKRGGDQDAHNAVNRQAVTQFLLEMNSMEKSLDNIFVISATNRYWEIDPALRRSKRLGDMKYVPLPNGKERTQLIEYYINKAKKASGNTEKEEDNIIRKENVFLMFFGAVMVLMAGTAIISAQNLNSLLLIIISFVIALTGIGIMYYGLGKKKSAKKPAKGIAIDVKISRINRALINSSPADIDTVIDKSLFGPIKRKDKTLYTKDIIDFIKTYNSSTQNWFDSTYTELRGRPVYDYRSENKQIIDYEGGKLSPEEVGEYHDLIEDIKKNTNGTRKLHNKIIKTFAIYMA